MKSSGSVAYLRGRYLPVMIELRKLRGGLDTENQEALLATFQVAKDDGTYCSVRKGGALRAGDRVHFEFTSGTELNSRALYRMAPAKLKELKTQLQELIDKRFIHSSFSLWGAPVLYKCKEGCVELKIGLTTASISVLQEVSGNFVSYSVVLQQGLGFVLIQHGRVRTYASQQLKKHESKSSSLSPREIFISDGRTEEAQMIAERQKSSGFLQPLPISEGKRE
ncbi:hypothetical protein L3X38_010256 [Prunus dulcis]|uniref:Uncharacterized protein n=1 Tax=Prunus dulcis TaxID=3755 RepID=A0AAD4ZE99_PRUDU|nr:hypothetical protein L3X38_010256 [Prunus dulcis]